MARTSRFRTIYSSSVRLLLRRRRVVLRMSACVGSRSYSTCVVHPTLQSSADFFPPGGLLINAADLPV